MTDLERAAWTLMRQEGLPKPEREYRFHPSRRWRWDFCWPEQMVALEIEGGAFSGGRHTRGPGFQADCEKQSVAAALGWRVLRATAYHVESGQFLEWVRRALERAA